jgi:hypothetical protein
MGGHDNDRVTADVQAPGTGSHKGRRTGVTRVAADASGEG